MCVIFLNSSNLARILVNVKYLSLSVGGAKKKKIHSSDSNGPHGDTVGNVIKPRLTSAGRNNIKIDVSWT